MTAESWVEIGQSLGHLLNLSGNAAWQYLTSQSFLFVIWRREDVWIQAPSVATWHFFGAIFFSLLIFVLKLTIVISFLRAFVVSFFLFSDQDR